MKKHSKADQPEPGGSPNNASKSYSRLFWDFILWTVLCSIIPLFAVGLGINIHYTKFAKSRMISTLKTRADYHRKIIELFIEQQTSNLRQVAYTHSKAYLQDSENLNHVYEIINKDKSSITDLGVIDETGRHLAYIGPYDLLDKNYSRAVWFKEVMEKGLYISDMFMGFRKEPHFIIAVARTEGIEKWILRATVNTDVFRSLVENVKIGKTGEVFLLNKKGVLQTSPRFSGNIMDMTSFPIGPSHDDVRVDIYKGGQQNQNLSNQIVATTWLNNPQWMLVIKQDYKEAFNAVNHANYWAMVFLFISVLSILIVTVFITKIEIKVIKKRDIRARNLNNQLMQAGKLAAIGELAAGVAHEINNPLAIILTERQLLLDAFDNVRAKPDDFKEQFKTSMNQVDVQAMRCKRITQNLLRFARRTQSRIETVDINRFIGEVIELMEREARSSGIKFIPVLDDNLPPILSDTSQLQQVFLNLITNAIDAHEGKPYGTIRITTQVDSANNGNRITIADTGSGISKENIDKIFDPFFTTKPVGKGTGLGLSICYSIICRLGGDISVSSKPGEGTEFILFLPHDLPQELKDDMDYNPKE